MAGTLDNIMARVEAYMGEFLQSRQSLMDAGDRINAALDVAQVSGSAMIGKKRFTYAELSALASENERLLAENADLHNQIIAFKDKVAALQSGAESVLDTLVTDNPWYDVPGLMEGGMGAFPIVVPAAALVASGAVLATAVYLFLSKAKRHVSNVAGDVASNLLIYGGIALLGYWYFTQGRKR